jgi:two-component system, NarL family, nitrate/nitrite response regulator NarL
VAQAHDAVRVLVVDDHPLFRDGVIRALTDDPSIEVVGEAADGSEALSAIADLTPDVVVLDVRLPGMDGPQVLKAMQDRGDGSRVLFLSAFDEPSLVHDALARGAAGYVCKDADESEIRAAVRAVADGHTHVEARLHEGVFAEMSGAGERPTLSARERQIAALMADGRSSREIAELLYISPSTVKTHTRRICEKLGVSDRTAAVAEAIRRGLVS